ncbi:hypothetical protein Pint_14580 [Pistacia integerrima]|uniref:Uncharacterized protein n=1 Tax=Pistacia integerrima TaxID=434235 RepID=A0ACC0Y9I2_9ROSI|nr:hypothetical protein Pint_14580 [Pistacia integerrima]
MTTSTQATAITPNRKTRTTTITKDNPNYDLKDRNEDNEDEDEDDNASTTNQMPRMLRDMSIAILSKLKGFSPDNDNITPNDGAIIGALTMNQVPRMLGDMSIAVRDNSEIFPLTTTISTPTAIITPIRTNRTATMMKDDQESDPDYDLKDDNEDNEDEDEDKDDK